MRGAGRRRFLLAPTGPGSALGWDLGAPRCRPGGTDADRESAPGAAPHRALPPTGTAPHRHRHRLGTSPRCQYCAPIPPSPPATPEPCAPVPDPLLSPSTGTGTPSSLSLPHSRYRNPPYPNPMLGYRAGSPLSVPGSPSPYPIAAPPLRVITLRFNGEPLFLSPIPGTDTTPRPPAPPLSHRCTSGTDPLAQPRYPDPLPGAAPIPPLVPTPGTGTAARSGTPPGPGAPHPLPLRSGTGQRLRVPTAPPRSGGRSPSPGAAPTGLRCPGRPLRDRGHGHPRDRFTSPPRSEPCHSPPRPQDRDPQPPLRCTQRCPGLRGRAGGGEVREQSLPPPSMSPPPPRCQPRVRGVKGKRAPMASFPAI